MHSKLPPPIALFVLLSALVHGQSAPTFMEGEDPRPDGLNWVPVEKMSDEFNGKAVDLRKWQIEPNENSFTWIGRPPGLFQAKNVSVSEGSLQVEVGVLDEPWEGEEGLYTYYGGIVRSITPGDVGYYFECRMKANATEMSSTFWLLTEGGYDEALELDIQECVGRVTPLTRGWARNWDRVFHSNTIHWRYFSEPRRVQKSNYVQLDEKNSSRYFVYGAWWKSDEEIQFFLDGVYQYSIRPDSTWDIPAYLHMAIETYDWNPVPEDGGMVASGTKEERTTKYDWIRTWKLVNE
ncbi:MAG: glycosyl hydrolase [Verrucomicrobiota bacterium]